MPTATVTSQGQIAIPKEVREALGLESGDRVAFRVVDSVATMEPETVDIKELFGSLVPVVVGVTVEDMRGVVAARAAGR